MDNGLTVVSVIITNYNYGRFLGRAIRSCLQQSMARDLYEVIVVDDCSADHSKSIIENFRSQVRPIFNEKRMGVAYCSNLGIRHSRGIFVIRVDADDYINFKTLEILMMFLNQNPKYAFAYCDHIRVNESEEKEERIYLDSEKVLLEHGAGVMFKKSCLEDLGLYDEDMLNCEDMVLLKNLIQHGHKGIYVQLPLYRYFRHGANMTEDLSSRKKWKTVAMKKIRKGITKK